MKRRLFVLLVVVVGLLMGSLLSAAAQAQQPPVIEDVDTSNLPEIVLLVTPPLDAPGDYSTPEAWNVTENDEALEISVETLSSERASLAIVIDTSQSMAGPAITAAKSAAVDLIGDLNDRTSIAVIGFGASPTVVQPFTTSKDDAVVAVGSLATSGETSLYDAIALAVEISENQAGRQAIVVLSDGADTVSSIDLDEAVGGLNRWDGKLYAVELVTDETAEGPLEALAIASGGELLTVESTGLLSAAFDRIGDQIGRLYRITLTSTGPGGLTRLAVGTSTGGPVAEQLLRLPSTAPPSVTSTTPTTVAALPALLEGIEVQSDRFATPVVLNIALVALFLGIAGMLIPFTRNNGPKPAKPATRSFRSRRQRILSGVTGSLVEIADRGNDNTGLTAAIERAGLKLRAGEWIILTLSAMVVAMFVGVVAAGSAVVGIVLALFTGVAGWQLIHTLAARRRTAFELQLPEMLQLLASTIRTGYAPIQASELVSREIESPAAEELARVVAETRLGRNFSQALRSMADRLDSVDMRWVSDAIEINQEVGGDVSELIDQVASTIRDRVSVKRLVQSLSAEGRASAWVLILLPIAIGGYITATNPQYMEPLFTTTIGRILIAAAAISMIIGALVIRRMVDLKY